MIMCVLLCYPVSIRIYYQQGVLFLVCNEFGFLLDISSKINLHVWFYFIVFLAMLYITLETGSHGVERFALSECILFLSVFKTHFTEKCRFCIFIYSCTQLFSV